MVLEIHLSLKSDATFGRGDGVAGLIDAEVEHDEYGMPYLRGRTLKGLLVEECANLLYATNKKQPAVASKFEQVAKQLFGQAGSSLNDDGLMQVGAAMLPTDLRKALKNDVIKGRWRAEEILESLTAIRRQTAVSEKTSAPEKNSLRSMRIILRETIFVSRLNLTANLQASEDDVKGLLAACVLSLRRAGTGRNRGRGRLNATLHNKEGKDITGACLAYFRKAFPTEEEVPQ